MKKFLALILSLTLAATLLVGLASCKDKTNGDDGKVDYTWDITDGVLNSFKVTDKAKELISDKKYGDLATGFNTNTNRGDSFTADTVKTLDLSKAKVIDKSGNYTPATITKITANAVADLSYIEEIIVPETVEEIELGAFSNLSSLKKITLPFAGSKKGAQAEKKLFGYIFGTASSASLTSCTQTYNGGDKDNTATYYVPTSLETVVITGEIKKGEKDIYYVIDEEEGTMTIVDESRKDEEGVKTAKVDTYDETAVMPYAFSGITTIKNVEINGSEIFEGTFKGCTLLNGVTTKAESLIIGKSAFDGCTSLKEELFKKVTEIGEGAFKGCTSLGKSTDYAIGNLDLSNVTKIDESAFDGCTEMTTLTLNASIVPANKAFNGCSKLIEVKKGDVKLEIEKDDKIFTNCNEKLYTEKTEGTNENA